MDEEAQEQFEVELRWCIQQLQKSLSSNRLNSKQAQDATRTLKTLRSTKAPLAKKRQAMSISFGNYRSKMEEEEKKIRKANNDIKFKEISSCKKYLYVKKSASIRLGEEEKNKQLCSSHINIHLSDNSFRFNFTDD